MSAALKSSSKGNSIGRALSPTKGETAFARPHARKVGKRSPVFLPSHTQVDWRLYVEGDEEADADAAALLADVFAGDAADEVDESAAPACGWPRFDAALRSLRDAAGEDAPAPARNEAERFAALVRILVAPRP